MPQDGSDLLGVGVLTDGWLVVSTSHGGPDGVLDSEVQIDASDPEPHNHYVYLNGDVQCPASPVGDLQLSVADLSWESPGDYKWDDNEIKITGIETGVPTSTIHSGAAGEEGAVIAVDTGAISDNVVSFQLAGGPNDQICVIINDIITASD